MSNVLWKYIKLMSLFSLFLCLFLSCNSKNRLVEQNVSSLLNQDVDWLKGKIINSLDSVLGNVRECKIVYIFNYYDCEACIEKGFKTVDFIDKNNKEESVKVIVSMFREITSTQRRNLYKGFIYKDKKDLLRKELKYIPTPVMLIVDNNNQIKDVYIFEMSHDSKRLDDFVQKCFSVND